jgi:hypothetical protein
MYQLPDKPKGAKYVITRDIVEGKAPLQSARQELKETA